MPSLTMLQNVRIVGCDTFRKNYGGEEWRKIYHVRKIEVFWMNYSENFRPDTINNHSGGCAMVVWWWRRYGAGLEWWWWCGGGGDNMVVVVGWSGGGGDVVVG
ncbi:hypothetical protein RHMOL_Rhmol03G0047600 [Rhododendron molle]|uniref:Uncharacterized protein n=1 Tax=Rhododendron molle TaxID=49168 RepID=A0ACC0PBN4_RHOML|nr:hypothetical protein RHMOL_Rhmol03G0047600 [Rhododendron molle]